MPSIFPLDKMRKLWYDTVRFIMRTINMSEPQPMAATIMRIEQAMQRVVQAITPLSSAQMLEPRLSDGRSVKDILAHLTWWDQWLLFTLPADQNTPRTPSTPPLVDQIPLTDPW